MYLDLYLSRVDCLVGSGEVPVGDIETPEIGKFGAFSRAAS